MKLFFVFHIAVCLLATSTLWAKETDYELIKRNIDVSEFKIDPEASAVILYENINTDVTLVDDRLSKKRIVHKIVKILKNEALDAANIHIIYPENDYKNYVYNVKGTTYNLQNGQIVATALGGKDLLKKEVIDGLHSVSFSLPAVKEGCIIDYSYEVVTDYHEMLFTWHIQEEYPKLVSIYTLIYPAVIEFTPISNSNLAVTPLTKHDDLEKGNYAFASVNSVTVDGHKAAWVRRNIPGTKSEPYIVNLENYKERYELQMTRIGKGYQAERFNNSWTKLNEKIWKTDSIKRTINGNNMYFDAAIDSLRKPGMSATELTTAIYKYVRSRFTYNGKKTAFNDIVMAKAYYADAVTLTEKNMLLVAMLVRAGIPASPIILSSTDDVSLMPDIPVIDRVDNIGCAVVIDSTYMLLDATDKNNSIGFLPQGYYNGFSWILAEKGVGMYLTPALLKNKTSCSIRLSAFSDSTAKIEITQKMGMVTSAARRKEWDKDKKAPKEYTNQVKHELPACIEIDETNIVNQNNPDTNIIVKYVGRFRFEKNAEQVYLNASIISLFDKNPFITAERKHPIEFPFQTEYMYSLTVALPQTLVPDSVYKPVIIDFESGAIMYKKITNYYPEMNTLNINSSFSINSTTYPVTSYNYIREFFQNMIADNNQIIVLKRNAIH